MKKSPQSAKSQPIDLTHFNPGTQNETDFLASFIARQNTFNYFLGELRNVAPHQAARHHLIMAPRGYGKTSLLRRLHIALRNLPEFNTRFIALAFREEQHNVISLDVFWRNCIQSLLEAREDEQAPAIEIAALDALWEQHLPRGHLKREEQDGAVAWAAFDAECRRIGRRPVLLVDNLDALLAGLEHHQWGLRTVLQHANGPVLIAAASRYPEQLSDSKAAFFDFFRITTLPRLTDHEVMDCLRTLADRRGDRGAPVRHLLDTDVGRISALNTMAGGNPRTLGVLYSVLEAHISDDVLAQLSAMLDTFTGWYQARTEELPMQSRAVFDALALNWDPMTAAALATVSGLETTAVSSHLSRLEKAGYVETVSLSSTRKSRNGYQVAERFFNIWYLMRNGPRRTRQAIRWLTVFLSSCFSQGELRGMAKERLKEQGGKLESILALAASLRAGPLRTALLDIAERRMTTGTKDTELKILIEEMVREDKLALRKRMVKFLNSDNAGSKSVEWRTKRLRTLGYSDTKFNEGWEITGMNLGLEGPTRECEAVLRKSIELDSTDIVSWIGLGTQLSIQKRYEEAAVAFSKVVQLDPNEALAWRYLGVLLSANLKRYDEARDAYIRAIELDEGDVDPIAWHVLGDLLQDHTGEFVAALNAYRSAISSDDNDRLASSHCVYLYAFHMNDRTSAIEYAAKAGLSHQSNPLLESALAWSDAPPLSSAQGWQKLNEAIATNDTWSNFETEVLRILTYALVQGDGPNVRKWMQQANYPQQYAPLYHAFCAALDGPDHLLSINPEVRGAASRLYEDLARMRGLFIKHRQATAAGLAPTATPVR